MSKTPSKYPEHDKLQAISSTSQAIYDFLEDLQGKGVMLGHYVEIEGYREEQFQPLGAPVDKLLAAHFDIDLDKIEGEKRQMIEEMRELNQRSEQTENQEGESA